MDRSRGHLGKAAGELTMYWEEANPAEAPAVPDTVVDVAFTITCRCLPVDHAYALSRALLEVLPWLADEPQAGMHPIHVAESGNGWIRPEGSDELLHLSRRTKLVLRVPRERVEDSRRLLDQTLDVAGHSMQVHKAAIRPLSTHTTLFSRHVVMGNQSSEEEFLDEAMAQLGGKGIRPRKMLPGKGSRIRTPQRSLWTRSLMLADLSIEESVKLQEEGLGEHQHLGCGLFIPHKDIREVHEDR